MTTTTKKLINKGKFDKKKKNIQKKKKEKKTIMCKISKILKFIQNKTKKKYIYIYINSIYTICR